MDSLVVVGGVLLALLLILSLRPLRSASDVPSGLSTGSSRRSSRSCLRGSRDDMAGSAAAAGLTPKVAERVERKRVAQEEAKRIAALSATMARLG